MPLMKGKSKAAFDKNVETEVNAGKPVKQAVAIAYSEQGEKKQVNTHHKGPKSTASRHGRWAS